MNARLTIQQLRVNLTELEKCYLTLKNLNGHSDYETLVESIKKNVSHDINNFIKLNNEINLNLSSSNENADQKITSENQIQAQMTKEVEELNNAQKNYEEIQSINRDLNDLQDIMIQFGNLVHVNIISFVFYY